MKHIILFCSFMLLTGALKAQEADSAAKPETFEYEWGGEKLTMQKYFIAFLKSGPDRSQTEAEAQKLQEAHLEYLGGLYEDGIINLNGPTGEEGEIRGFSVYNVATMEEAEKLANQDPMVKAGRLVVEIHPWWLAKGAGMK